MTERETSSAVNDLLAAVSGHSRGDETLPVSSKMRKRNARLLQDAKPGDLLEELGGIYLGIYEPRDTGGNSLGLTFNVIAAPCDLRKNPAGVLTFADTVKAVAALSNWHGYSGENYACAREIYQALKDGSYKGGWIIPPIELLAGQNLNHFMQPDNMFRYKDQGAFAGTFTTENTGGIGMPQVYWSTTEPCGDPSRIVSCSFAGRFVANNADYKDAGFMSCRPVRLMRAKQGGPA
jgi:hypothetical protein